MKLTFKHRKIFFLLIILEGILNLYNCSLDKNTNKLTVNTMNSLNNANSNLNMLTNSNNFSNSAKNSNTAANSNSASNSNSNSALNSNTNSAANSNSNTNTNSITATNTNQAKAATSEKLNLNGGIFVSEKFLKQKKTNKEKKSNNYQVGSSVSDASTPNTKINMDTDLLAKSSNLLKIPGVTAPQDTITSPPTNDLTFANGPIYLEGWVKFFKYSDLDTMTDTPKQFFKNNEYYHQLKLLPNVKLDAKENGMNTYIKDPSFFYIVLFANSLNFVSSRQIKLQKNFDSLNLEYILPVPESPGYNSGGILDFGNYNEGYCFKIVVRKYSLTNWIICTEDLSLKNNLMSLLKKLKLKQQRENGIVVNESNLVNNKETISKVLNPESNSEKTSTPLLKRDGKGDLTVQLDSKSSLQDGYWIIMQDWTQCSLKCGSGTSTLQRMCVPPKNGGKPCEGSNILTKSCNTQPCPANYNSNFNGNNGNVTTLKPVVKVMPFSTRPQRYTKCIIKESDLMMTQKTDQDNSAVNNNPLLLTNTQSEIQRLQIPTRVVMNNRTITVFAGENYDTMVVIFNLIETKFFKSPKYPNCFLLVENTKKQVELCPFGCDSVSKAIDQWDDDFHLFQNQCNTPKDLIDVDEGLLNKQLEEKIKKAKDDMLDDRQKMIKKKIQVKEERERQTILKTTNKIALQAIQKEMNLEDMIKKEEADRENEMEAELLENIEKEKAKSQCIMKVIHERQIENQLNIKNQKTEEDIKNIKETAAQQVIIRRNQLKNTILEMRKKAMKRQKFLEGQLHNVRLEVAGEMGKAYKRGDKAKCVEGVNSDSVRDSYCTANFVDNYNELQMCKDAEEFITICCDQEFGDFYNNERLDCYKTLNEIFLKNKTNNNSEESTEGKWLWHDKAA